MFEGVDKRVWQSLKDFKNDTEFHYVTIKSKTLICYFNQNTPVRQSVRQSIHLCWVRNDQKGYEMTKKGYEMTWVRIDHHMVISHPVDLGTKWPNWVRNDLGTKWLLLGTKWPKVGMKWQKKVRNDLGTKWLATGCNVMKIRSIRFFFCFFLAVFMIKVGSVIPLRSGSHY